MTPALETVGLHTRFGALIVANEIHFRLEAGARHALSGPNGAGKTTFINLITGRLAPSAGRILLGGDDVTALPQSARVGRGLGRTFQINTLFKGLTVLENVCLAVGEHARTGGIAGEIAAVVTESAFEDLDGPIRRVSSLDRFSPASRACTMASTVSGSSRSATLARYSATMSSSESPSSLRIASI